MNPGRVLIAAILLFYISIGLSYSRAYDGSRIFTKPLKTYHGVVLKSNELASKKEVVSTFRMSRDYMDEALLSSNEALEISSFPVNTYECNDIILEKAPAVVDGGTIFIAKSDVGEKQFKGPMVVSFKGRIKNNPESKVFLSYCGGFLTGYVESGDGYKYDITTSKDDFLAGKYIVSVSEQNVRMLGNPAAEAFKCYTDENSFGNSNYYDDLKKFGNNVQAGKAGLLECKVSLEGTYDYFMLMGKDSSIAAKYMVSVMAHVSKLYEEYINVRITVPYIIIYTTQNADPYIKANITTFSQKLTYMPKVWGKLPQGSALMSMFTSLTSSSDGSATAGISYQGEPGVGNLCNATGKKSYSVFGITGGNKYPNYNYTWDVSVAAHEIGHIFGAPHTHSCYYAPNLIDTCVTKSKPIPTSDACLDGDPKPALGTIMSYCHMTNSTKSVDLSFHHRQVEAMRHAAELALCINAPANPYISLLNPAKEKFFVSGKVVKIRWTSSKVSNVAIRYSTDKGAEWQVITGSTPSNDTVYEWIAPDVNSAECLIIISDASNQSVADTTDVLFSIIRPVITCIEPGEGRHYGMNEIMRINWEASVSKSFNIEYSTGGSSKWENIISGITGNNHNWDIPDITAPNCRIRITDTEDKSLIALSPEFAIGSESLKLAAPAAGEEICSNRQYKITWQSDYVNLIYLRFSLDGGENWKKNFAPIDATQGFFMWNVPETESDSVKLRILLKDNLDIVLDETQYMFSIKPCETNSADDYSAPAFRLLSIVPNPAGSRATIYYECSDASAESIELYVVNLLGQVVAAPASYGIDCGAGSIGYDFGSLARGSYMLMARVNGKVTGMMVAVE